MLQIGKEKKKKKSVQRVWKQNLAWFIFVFFSLSFAALFCLPSSEWENIAGANNYWAMGEKKKDHLSMLGLKKPLKDEWSFFFLYKLLAFFFKRDSNSGVWFFLCFLEREKNRGFSSFPFLFPLFFCPPGKTKESSLSLLSFVSETQERKRESKKMRHFSLFGEEKV